MYSPVRVSTLIRSPVSTNSGTWSTLPVTQDAIVSSNSSRSTGLVM